LKPEHQTEQEFGIDMIMKNRHSLQLVYAASTVKDQLLQIPLPGLYGYSTQWQNAGTIESTTYEVTLETMLVQRPELQWSMNIVGDRTRTEITEFNRGCYGSTPYYCAGELLGTVRGYKFLSNMSQLPSAVEQAGSGEFAVNDDGLLVWVGQGNSYEDGLWGTTGEVGGRTFTWGMPIFETDEQNNRQLVPIGDSNPDFNLGFGSNLQWKGFNFYALFDAKFGGDVYNNTRQWAYRDYNHADYDQAGKAEELKKPVTYYQALYNTNSLTSWFIEDGSYVKFREMSVQYGFNREQLSSIFGGLGVERVAVGLIGRNLITWSDYTGFDPEVGSIRNPYDGFGYPNFRTFTAKVDVTF
jgi:hypothetical protein